MNLRRKFITFSILLGIIPVIISTIICIANFNARSMKIIKQTIITAANDQSINLEYFFKQNISNHNSVTNMPITQELSKVLSEVFQDNSIIGRIGGDEFIVFLKDVKSEDCIYKKAEFLIKGFKADFIGENPEHKISASIGIAKYPQNGKSYKELFVNADKAVYLAKKKGKDNYCFFEEI